MFASLPKYEDTYSTCCYCKNDIHNGIVKKGNTYCNDICYNKHINKTTPTIITPPIAVAPIIIHGGAHQYGARPSAYPSAHHGAHHISAHLGAHHIGAHLGAHLGAHHIGAHPVVHVVHGGAHHIGAHHIAAHLGAHGIIPGMHMGVPTLRGGRVVIPGTPMGGFFIP